MKNQDSDTFMFAYISVDCNNVTNGNIGFCGCKSCSENEGECDSDNDCEQGLVCGSNNCLDYLGFNSEVDCCYGPAVGDEHFCSFHNPCAVDEGDCDSNNECQANLFCDLRASSCPAHLGFASDVNCCSSGVGCKSDMFLLV